MGRRSRKRGLSESPRDADAQAGASLGAPPDEAAKLPPRRRAKLDDAPRPPWAPVPLTELCIFVGIVVIVVGMLGGSPRGLLLGFGFALVIIATLELSLREHLAGYRSHSVLIAACIAALISLLLVALSGLAKSIILGAAALVFGLCWAVLRNLFRSRSGGKSWRA